MTEFGYLVVGGGTAGCIVAARLAGDPAVSVNPVVTVMLTAERAAGLIRQSR